MMQEKSSNLSSVCKIHFHCSKDPKLCKFFIPRNDKNPCVDCIFENGCKRKHECPMFYLYEDNKLRCSFSKLSECKNMEAIANCICEFTKEMGEI